MNAETRHVVLLDGSHLTRQQVAQIARGDAIISARRTSSQARSSAANRSTALPPDSAATPTSCSARIVRATNCRAAARSPTAAR